MCGVSRSVGRKTGDLAMFPWVDLARRRMQDEGWRIHTCTAATMRKGALGHPSGFCSHCAFFVNEVLVYACLPRTTHYSEKWRFMYERGCAAVRKEGIEMNAKDRTKRDASGRLLPSRALGIWNASHGDALALALTLASALALALVHHKPSNG